MTYICQNVITYMYMYMCNYHKFQVHMYVIHAYTCTCMAANHMYSQELQTNCAHAHNDIIITFLLKYIETVQCIYMYMCKYM